MGGGVNSSPMQVAANVIEVDMMHVSKELVRIVTHGRQETRERTDKGEPARNEAEKTSV